MRSSVPQPTAACAHVLSGRWVAPPPNFSYRSRRQQPPSRPALDAQISFFSACNTAFLSLGAGVKAFESYQAYRRPQPSVELPITRRGRAVCDVSHVWHAPRACHGHSHEWPRHARIAPLVSGVILGLSVYVLGPRCIVLKGRDRPNARGASAEAIDHRPAILADEAGPHLIPAPHRSALGHARIVGSVEWAQARLDQHLVHALCDRRAAVLLEARGVEHPVAECSVASLSLDYALGYGLGGHLEPHIGARSAVPLPVPHERATREQSIWAAFGAAHVVVVGDDRPPTP